MYMYPYIIRSHIQFPMDLVWAGGGLETLSLKDIRRGPPGCAIRWGLSYGK